KQEYALVRIIRCGLISRCISLCNCHNYNPLKEFLISSRTCSKALFSASSVSSFSESTTIAAGEEEAKSLTPFLALDLTKNTSLTEFVISFPEEIPSVTALESVSRCTIQAPTRSLSDSTPEL